MSFTPTQDRVFLKELSTNQRVLDSGFIVVGQADNIMGRRGEILAVGPGKDGQPVGVEVGDVVLFNRYGATELTVEGSDVLMVKAYDLIAVVEGEPAEVAS